MCVWVWEYVCVCVCGILLSVYICLPAPRCASLCSIRLSCFSWAWEPSSWECKVYTSLSSTSARTTAPASTLTYGVIDGYFFENFPSPVAMSWAEAKSACESRGAFLAMPASQEQTKLLMQWVGYNYAWVGIWRYSAAATWFDVFDNVVAGLYWAPAEPEDPYEWGSYRVPSGGLVTTPTTQRTYIPLCKTLP